MDNQWLTENFSYTYEDRIGYNEIDVNQYSFHNVILLLKHFAAGEYIRRDSISSHSRGKSFDRHWDFNKFHEYKERFLANKACHDPMIPSIML